MNAFPTPLARWLARATVLSVIGIFTWRSGHLVAGIPAAIVALGLAAVEQDGPPNRLGASIVQIWPNRRDPPEGLSPELGTRSIPLLYPVSELVSHVVEEEVGVDMQRASGAVEPRCVAGAAADRVKDLCTAYAPFGGGVHLRRSEKHGEADQRKEVIS